MKIKFVIVVPLVFALSYHCWGQNEIHARATISSDTTQSIHTRYYLSDDTYYRRTDSAIQSLTVREKIKSAIYNPESFHQDCSFYRSATAIQFLSSHLLNDYASRHRSQRQQKIIREYRDSIIVFLLLEMDSIQQIGDSIQQIGDYTKGVIVDLHGYECIPALLDIYAKNNDTDILTICMLLMNDDKFPPFLETKEYKELYEDPPKSSQSLRLVIARQIPLAQENITSVTTLARQYYAWKSSTIMKERK